MAAKVWHVHQNLALSVNAVNLEDVLRKVQPDRGNLIHGRLLEMGCRVQRPHLGTMMPRWGPSTPSFDRPYRADIPCRVEIFKYRSGTFEPLILLSTQGTQNQSVIPYNGGLLIVGANHGLFGGYPALQGWIVNTARTNETPG